MAKPKSKVEIEIKLPIFNGDEVIAFLQKNGTFLHESSQLDEYYNLPHRDLLANPQDVTEWFRIRVSNGQAQINYKDFQPHGAKIKTHCKEYEANVDSYDHLSEILTALNFTKLVEVKKLRKSWDFQDAEISIDSVDGLGHFIEVEYRGDLDDIAAARKYLFTVLERLGAKTGESDTKGYPWLMLEKQGLL